jgi:hypothetical protein
VSKAARNDSKELWHGTRTRGGVLSVAAYTTMTAAFSTAAIGFELLSRRTRDASVAVAVESAAHHLRSLLDVAVTAAAHRGIDARPRARTKDRLRWEWLASTAVVVDGESDRRLLSECARILGEAVHSVEKEREDGAPRVDLEDALDTRLRLASAEAFSLAHVVEAERKASEEIPG